MVADNDSADNSGNRVPTLKGTSPVISPLAGTLNKGPKALKHTPSRCFGLTTTITGLSLRLYNLTEKLPIPFPLHFTGCSASTNSQRTIFFTSSTFAICKTSGSFFLMGRLAAPAVTGAAAYFPFPDDINNGIISVRGGESSWLVTASKNLKTLEGADNNATLTELDPQWANSSFRYFTLAGKRYVAVARQDSSAAGRLIVLEGEEGIGWGQIVTGGKVVYEAAIQNDTENEALDETPSARFSGNSGMDLDVYRQGEDVYIAVIKQNVGLSLFRVSNDE